MLGFDAMGMHTLNLYDWPDVTPPANTTIMTTRTGRLSAVTADISALSSITSSRPALSQVTL